MSQIKPLARRADIVMQEIGNEILIFDLKINKAFSLNKTSALVWQNCHGELTLAQIAEKISPRFNSPVNEELVWLALEKLSKENLIENEIEVARCYQGISRREIIRKVGLTTLAAWPMVSSLVVPEAIHAQSSVCFGTCRCPNAATSCNGSLATVGGIPYVSCFGISGGLSNCDCVGPFGPDNSAGSGFKASLFGCTLT
jgi:hypothetical protein